MTIKNNVARDITIILFNKRASHCKPNIYRIAYLGLVLNTFYGKFWNIVWIRYIKIFKEKQ